MSTSITINSLLLTLCPTCGLTWFIFYISGLGQIPWGQVECDRGLPLHHPHLQHQHLRRPLRPLPLLLCHQGALKALWPGSQVLLCQGGYFPLLLARGGLEYHGGLSIRLVDCVAPAQSWMFRQAEWFNRFTATMAPTPPLQEQYQLAIRTFSSASRCFLLLWLWSELVAWEIKRCCGGIKEYGTFQVRVPNISLPDWLCSGG